MHTQAMTVGLYCRQNVVRWRLCGEEREYKERADLHQHSGDSTLKARLKTLQIYYVMNKQAALIKQNHFVMAHGVIGVVKVLQEKEKAIMLDGVTLRIIKII